MSLSAPIQEGTVARFDTTSLPVTSIAGVVTDPDLMIFSYIVPGIQAEKVFTWTNPSGDPSGNIIHDGVGLFHIELPTGGLPGNWIYSWYAKAIGGPDVTQTTVKWESTQEITASNT